MHLGCLGSRPVLPPSTITHPLKNRGKTKEIISVQTNETCFKKPLGKKKNELTGHRYKHRDAAGVFTPVHESFKYWGEAGITSLSPFWEETAPTL